MAESSINALERGTSATTIESPDISTLCNRCLHGYSKLFEAVRSSSSEESLARGFERDVKLIAAQDSRSRLKIWAVNIAAIHKAHLPTSLDFRLKDATEIRGRIIKILEELESSLEKATDIATGNAPNRTWRTGYISDSEEEDEDILEDDEDFPKTSELDQLFSTLNATNTNLMKLSMIIRNSPSRDDYLKAASRYSFDPRYDIGHVKEKHGPVKRHNNWLTERLGKCITRRRQFLKYREEHHGKLARDYDDICDEQKEETIAMTKATTFVESKTNPQGGRPRPQEDASFGSQTSYDQTVAGEATENKLVVPPPPKEAFEGIPFQYGEHFQCPYCYTEQIVHNRNAWKKHVFRDLRPYVCTFKECNMKMFRSRTEWFVHELKSHRRQWICILCAKTHTTESSFVSHLETQHQIASSDPQLQALILQSEESVESVPASACPLCDDWEETILYPKLDARRSFLNGGQDVKPYGTLKQFRRHLGRHMEQLALFALPMADTEDLEDGSYGKGESESDTRDGSRLEDGHDGSELGIAPAAHRPESEGRPQYRDAPYSAPVTSKYPPTSSGTVHEEVPTTKDSLGPKIWTGTQFLPRFVRQAEVPGEGICYFYEDGTHCKTVIDGEIVNAHWGVTKAGKPRKRLAIACITCREIKIKCDPDYPRCVQCKKFGRICKFKNAPVSSSGSGNHTPIFTGDFEEEQYLAAGPHVRNASHLADTPYSRSSQVPSSVDNAEVDDIEPYIIKCICGYEVDDNNTIYCEICGTWQHLECYYPDRIEEVSREDFNHACDDCKPRPMDRSGAAHRQRQRRILAQVERERVVVYSDGSEPSVIGQPAPDPEVEKKLMVLDQMMVDQKLQEEKAHRAMQEKEGQADKVKLENFKQKDEKDERASGEESDDIGDLNSPADDSPPFATAGVLVTDRPALRESAHILDEPMRMEDYSWKYAIRRSSSGSHTPIEIESIIEERIEREHAPSPPQIGRGRIRNIERANRQPSLESSLSPSPSPAIRAPPIHQEIVTHHRHIDHSVHAPTPTGRPSSPPLKSFSSSTPSDIHYTSNDDPDP